MKKLLNKMNSIEVKKSKKSDCVEETLAPEKISQPISAFDFGQEADDDLAEKVPTARNIFFVAFTVLLLSMGFAFMASNSKSSVEKALSDENAKTMMVSQQISGLVGGDRRLPDHVQGRANELAQAVQGSTDALSLWSALLETAPEGVFLTSMSVAPNAETAGSRDVTVTATVQSGVQIVAWSNNLAADTRFTLSPAGVSDENAPAVTAVLNVAPDLFTVKQATSAEANTAEAVDQPQIQAEETTNE